MQMLNFYFYKSQILPLQQQHRWTWDQTSQSCWIFFDFCLKLGSEASRVFSSVVFNIVEYSNNQNCCFQQTFFLPSLGIRNTPLSEAWELLLLLIVWLTDSITALLWGFLVSHAVPNSAVLPHLKDVENRHVTAKQLSYNKSGRWRTQALLLKGFQWTHVCTMVTPYIGD